MTFTELYKQYKDWFKSEQSWMYTPRIDPERAFQRHINSMSTHEFMETLISFESDLRAQRAEALVELARMSEEME